ncbi:probable disease resistance protein At1g61310 [Citrus clementina]|uniref:probable disease resistance protein At1g61310 n=1 Tax=Citrus clementina TaxID=85681 RepID=UPI000CED2573|nr:probable disease resistance protein At1g61310 [Citrus x clementina]
MAIEACLAFLTNCVSEGAKSLFNPITRQISYVFKYQSYIDELKDQVKQLGYKREMVQQPVNHARLQGDELYEGVTDWLHSVDEFISEGVAKSIIDDEDRAKKSCFKGLCPNLISRYKLSKQAAKAAEAAASLVGKGNFSNVSYSPAPKRAEHMQVKDFEAFDSRMKVFQDVMEAVKDDKVNIIGVYGMGGVGKTTLVKQVANQVMEDKLFDKFVMAEITQTPDHHKIQDKLAFDLGMEFDLNENEFQRASRLCQRLKQEKRLLIILDNIWTKLEFDTVGIPYGDVDEKDREDDRRRRTIILTSRSRDLLRNDMKSQKDFSIEVLSKEEALQLFGKIVCNSAKASAFQPLADEIVEKCGGLPVALITLAKALKNERLVIREDPNNHLKEFHVVCSTMKPAGVSEEQVKLMAFPFSLADSAKEWLYYLPSGTVTTWNEMRQLFLEKYFPASKAGSIRKEICGIRQYNGESLYDYWERFKKLCASCPHHQISDQLLIQYFYEERSTAAT